TNGLQPSVPTRHLLRPTSLPGTYPSPPPAPPLRARPVRRLAGFRRHPCAGLPDPPPAVRLERTRPSPRDAPSRDEHERLASRRSLDHAHGRDPDHLAGRIRDGDAIDAAPHGGGLVP